MRNLARNIIFLIITLVVLGLAMKVLWPKAEPPLLFYGPTSPPHAEGPLGPPPSE